MKSFPRTLLTSLILLLGGFAVAEAAQPSIQIVNLQGKETVFTLDELKKMPQVAVQVTNNHTKAIERYEGVRLAPLLLQAGAPVVAKVEGIDLRDYVVIEAADGYKVVFSLAELEPEFQDHLVILTLSSDGKPLPEKQGQFRVVVPQDNRLTRGVRKVTRIRILRAD